MKHVYYIMVISIILNGWFLLERVEWMILLSDVLMNESRFFTFALGRCAKSVLRGRVICWRFAVLGHFYCGFAVLGPLFCGFAISAKLLRSAVLALFMCGFAV